ncbi:MAG: DUF4886 domain-containing protein [Clostridia bacterium]|nr:DUF4886 domain-containing protein [Clostridia bacterium]
MKILSIGNSFSQDAHKWLHKLAKLSGFDIETANLYIGGCSLETHWKNAEENNRYYSLELNGNVGTRSVSIEEALKLETWDIVTLQQVSHKSGIPESYEPYLSSLANMVRELQPDAKLYFHQTWAYEIDSDRGGFANYNHDQAEMYNRIKQTTKMAAQSIHAALIPVGKAIQNLRETVPEFDYQNGGLSLCRDGFHLSLNYGRYAAAATWLHTMIGKKIDAVDFEDFNPELLKKIIDVVNEL